MDQAITETVRVGERALGALSPRQRVAALLSFVFLAALVLSIYELATGSLYYSSLEHRISLLRQLHELGSAGVPQDPTLNPIYAELVAELARPPFALVATLPIGKFLAGASLGIWLLLGQAWLTIAMKDPDDWKPGILLGLFLSVTLGVVGALIPDLGSPLVNIAVYFVVYVLAVAVIVRATPVDPGTTTSAS
jgi:hypothetical protein